ncbi:hypothetical protein ACJX0J_036838, partial [Zea mays]
NQEMRINLKKQYIEDSDDSLDWHNCCKDKHSPSHSILILLMVHWYCGTEAFDGALLRCRFKAPETHLIDSIIVCSHAHRYCNLCLLLCFFIASFLFIKVFLKILINFIVFHQEFTSSRLHSHVINSLLQVGRWIQEDVEKSDVNMFGLDAAAHGSTLS